MKTASLPLLLTVVSIAACSNSDNHRGTGESAAGADPAAAAVEEAPAWTCEAPAFDVGETAEILPGLDATLLKHGYGRRVEAGDTVDVHYTGWLFDPEAADNKGEKFDSSVDRDELFQFPLGAGRVIRGWDEGVNCMMIGEKRLLKIAPELGYGARGAGGVIPPNATLLFEVELFGARAPGE